MNTEDYPIPNGGWPTYPSVDWDGFFPKINQNYYGLSSDVPIPLNEVTVKGNAPKWYRDMSNEERAFRDYVNYRNSNSEAWKEDAPTISTYNPLTYEESRSQQARQASREKHRQLASYYARQSPTLSNLLSAFDNWTQGAGIAPMDEYKPIGEPVMLLGGPQNIAQLSRTARMVREFENAANEIDKAKEASVVADKLFPIRNPQVKTYNATTQEPPTVSWGDATAPSFKPELNWSPKSWFEDTAGRHYNDRSPNQYTDFDIEILQSHIPEYIEIEKRAKADGTWLKMPDGSTWQGDPRSWVQLQSKALKEGYNKDVLWSGREHGFNPEYTGDVWGVRGQGKIPGLQARTYSPSDKGVLPLISEDVPVVSHDAKGNSWRRVLGREEGEIRTNDVVNQDFLEGAKRVHIDNVRDPGPNFVPMSSVYRTGDKLLDYEILNIPQNDVIIAPGVIRKSLVGNNGDFSKIVKNNAFRTIFPLLTGYTSYKYLDE